MKINNIICIIITIAFTASCKQKLDYKVAENVILSSKIFSGENIEGLKLNVATDSSNIKKLTFYRLLEQNGIIKIAENKDANDILFYDRKNVSLTTIGKSYVSKKNPYNSDSSVVFFIISTTTFKNIDSIVEHKYDKYLDVYFKVRHTNITPIGKCMPEIKENMLSQYRFDFVNEKGNWEITYVH